MYRGVLPFFLVLADAMRQPQWVNIGIDSRYDS